MLGLLPRTRLSYQYKYGLNSTYMCGHIDSNTPLFYGTQKNGRRRRQSPEEIGGGAAQNSHTRRATAICDFGGQSSPAAMNRRRSCRRHARRVDCNPHGTPEARDAAAKPSLPPLRPPRAPAATTNGRTGLQILPRCDRPRPPPVAVLAMPRAHAPQQGGYALMRWPKHACATRNAKRARFTARPRRQ